VAEIRPWRVLREQLLLDRSPWLRVVEQDVVLPDDGILAGYLLREWRDYAMIFALTGDGRIPLVRQYKHGLRAAAYDLPGLIQLWQTDTTLSVASAAAIGLALLRLGRIARPSGA